MRPLFYSATATLAWFCVIGIAYATTPLHPIDARQQILKSMGAAMKSMMVMTAKNTSALPPEATTEAATLARLAPQPWPLFEPGTGGKPSEALPTVWDKPDAFKQRADALVQAANALDAAARTGDKAAFQKALATVGGTCKACHEEFKKD